MDDGAHLDAIRAPDLDDDDGYDPDAPIHLDDDGVPLDATPEQISREAFYVVFATAFSIPGMVDADFRPVAIQSAEEPAARGAADAVYSLLEIYYPSALLPQSETLAHVLVAGPFLVGKAMIVREILKAKHARPVAPPEEPKPEPQEPVFKRGEYEPDDEREVA